MASASEATNANGAEEISPDMLRNTPSNIRRLANEIEQFEGRHKYLAQTRSPSDGGDVRWYFCKVPLAVNELAASVPRTEIVGKGEYFRFGMRDSLAIEASFLQREEELLSSWWKEYADCSEGPRGLPGKDSTLNEDPEESSLESAKSTQLFEIEEERVGVPVKGGLYEVWHRRTFQPSGLFAARVDLQGSTPGLHALFTGEDDTWEAWLNADSSGFSNVINLGGNGIKLRRGYAPSLSPKPTQDELRQQKEEEMDDYCSQVPVRHLVFMVHGIGQRLEKSNLVDDVGDFRHVTESLAERHLTLFQRSTQRVLFIPCQWRKGLKLSGEHAVDKCTLDGVRKLRVMLSATVHDVLYYMSPIYCQAIIDSVSNQLNRLYLKFRKRNPGYDGKVSIYGHSLGSVLSYDILCHQDTLCSPFPMEWTYKEKDMDEQSQPSTSSDCNLTSNVENKGFADGESNSTKESAHKQETGAESAHKQETSAESGFQGLVDKEDGSFCSLVDPAASAHLNETTVMGFNNSEPNRALLADQSICELNNDSNDLISYEKGKTHDPMSMNSGVTEDYANKNDEEMIESDKDRTIQLLKEEIDLLNAKVNELECNYKGILEKAKTIPESLPPGPSDKFKSYTPRIKYTKLEFKVDTFFAVGSPLGVFLSLRNVRIGIGKGQNYWEEENIHEEMPACRQMFNIFHPFDPVAYRIEPLICKEYVNKRPVIIPYHRGGKRLYVGFQEFTEGLASHSQAVMDHISSLRVKVLTICESKNKDSLDEGSENVQPKEERPYGSIMMERVTGSTDGRVDHSLQDKTFRHPYLSAISSHTNYWRDPDTALFILKHLYRDIPEDLESPREPQGGSSKDESSLTEWSEQRDDITLTFADRMFVKDFSLNARKLMKR